MERYVIRGGREGYERLQLLARVRRPDTLALFQLVGIAPGSRCIDLGCGGGEVTFELAALAGPSGRVVGFDMDEVKLELGREAAVERGFGNVEFRSGNVNDWNEPASYDVVYSRFVLQHLRRPVDLLRKMWSAVAPGGVLVVEDADFDGLFCEPANDGFELYARLYPIVLERRGGDHAIGRKLFRYFLEAGIPAPELRLAQSADGPTKTLALSTLEATAEPIVEEGLATQAEVAAAIESLASFVDDPATTIGDPRILQVWARR